MSSILTNAAALSALQSLNMTSSDVMTALQSQNIQVASGVLNQQPMNPAGPFEVAVQTRGRLAEPDEFSEIVVKPRTSQNSKVMRLVSPPRRRRSGCAARALTRSGAR